MRFARCRRGDRDCAPVFPTVGQSKPATEGHTSRALRPGFRQRHTGMRMCDFNAEGVAREGVRIRRHVTSWYAFVIVLLGLGLASLFGLTMLRNQVEQRARKAAYDTASVAVALMVHRNVTEAELHGATGFTAIEIGDLDADVATLVRGTGWWVSSCGAATASTCIPTRSSARRVNPARLMRLRGSPQENHGSSPTPLIGEFTWRSSCHMTRDRTASSTGSSRCWCPTPRSTVWWQRPASSCTLAIAVLAVGGLGLMTLRSRLVQDSEHEASHDRLTGLMNWG